MLSSNNKLLLRALGFCLVVVLVFGLCNYAMYDDSTYTRLIMHEFYEEEEPIDLVFVSGSMTYKGFDPEIWDKQLDMYTFNFGSSSQTPDASYYLMKEVFRHQSPKYCIFATNYISFMDLNTYTNPQRHYILYDYFKPSLNKVQYWMHAFDEDTSLTALLPFMRDKSLSPERIGNILKAKASDTYRNYGYEVYVKSEEQYQGRGFVYREEGKEPGGVGRLSPVYFDLDRIAPESVAYFQKLVQLCRENDCELIMVPTPLPYGTMAMQEDYQQVTDFYHSLAEENGVQIFDFSMSRPELFYPEDSYFYDHVHLNGAGSQDFSTAASGVVKAYLEGKPVDENAFYGSYQELMDSSPYIFNTWMEIADSGYAACSTQGSGVAVEYRFSVRSSEEEPWQCIQEYGDSDYLSGDEIPEGTVQVRLDARIVGSTEDYQQFEVITP